MGSLVRAAATRTTDRGVLTRRAHGGVGAVGSRPGDGGAAGEARPVSRTTPSAAADRATPGLVPGFRSSRGRRLADVGATRPARGHDRPHRGRHPARGFALAMAGCGAGAGAGERPRGSEEGQAKGEGVAGSRRLLRGGALEIEVEATLLRVNMMLWPTPPRSSRSCAGPTPPTRTLQDRACPAEHCCGRAQTRRGEPHRGAS